MEGKNGRKVKVNLSY